MLRNEPTRERGVTLVELVIVTVLVAIPMLVVGTVLVDSQRGWQRMYDRVNSNIVTDGYIAQKRFDAVIRKASSQNIILDENNRWIEVNYYQGASSTVLDRYARFFVTDGNLNIEYGKLNPRQTLSIGTICSNVSDYVFRKLGRSAQMVLTLDNGTQTNTIISSSVAHN